jgi:hypothetical protein
MMNVHNNMYKMFAKGKFFNKVIEKFFIFLHTLTYRNYDLLWWAKLHMEKNVKFGTSSCMQTPS